MLERRITREQVLTFGEYLIQEEKSELTRQKYLRDVEAFVRFTEEQPIEKELVIAYKRHCVERGYAVRSVNSMLASINSFLTFLGWGDCRVKNLRLQREAYCAADRELTKAEYMRLLSASRGTQLYYVLQTICSTGIRVSELEYFTVEGVQRGEITVSCKNKTRRILVPGELRKLLLTFAGGRGIRRGKIFVTRTGKALDRSTIWARMKRLCAAAKVAPTKVFPHNLRKLFARSFYALEKDIAKLADILGHSSIETTRIYIMTTGSEHRKKIERLGLLALSGGIT